MSDHSGSDVCNFGGENLHLIAMDIHLLNDHLVLGKMFLSWSSLPRQCYLRPQYV